MKDSWSSQYDSHPNGSLKYSAQKINDSRRLTVLRKFSVINIIEVLRTTPPRSLKPDLVIICWKMSKTRDFKCGVEATSSWTHKYFASLGVYIFISEIVLSVEQISHPAILFVIPKSSTIFFTEFF